MKNWKTTLFGAVASVAGFVLFSPHYFPPWAVDAAKYIMLGGLAGLGFSSKDFNISGGPRGAQGVPGPAGADAAPVEITVGVVKPASDPPEVKP